MSDSLRDRIFALVKAKPGISARAVWEELRSEIHHRDFYALVSELEREGALVAKVVEGSSLSAVRRELRLGKSRSKGT